MDKSGWKRVDEMISTCSGIITIKVLTFDPNITLV